MEDLMKGLKFDIGDIAFAGFNTGNHVFIDIVSCKLQQTGQIPLGQVVFVAKFDEAFSNQIFLAG